MLCTVGGQRNHCGSQRREDEIRGQAPWVWRSTKLKGDSGRFRERRSALMRAGLFTACRATMCHRGNPWSSMVIHGPLVARWSSFGTSTGRVLRQTLWWSVSWSQRSKQRLAATNAFNAISSGKTLLRCDKLFAGSLRSNNLPLCVTTGESTCHSGRKSRKSWRRTMRRNLLLCVFTVNTHRQLWIGPAVAAAVIYESKIWWDNARHTHTHLHFFSYQKYGTT